MSEQAEEKHWTDKAAEKRAEAERQAFIDRAAIAFGGSIGNVHIDSCGKEALFAYTWATALWQERERRRNGTTA